MNNIEERKRDQKIDQLIEKQDRLAKSVSAFLRKPEKQANVVKTKDKFLAKKDIIPELLSKQNATLNKILKVETDTLAALKIKGKSLFGGLLGAAGLAGAALTQKPELLMDASKMLKYIPIRETLDNFVKGFAKTFGKLFVKLPFGKEITKVMTEKFGEKGVAKILGKTVLKKIPVVGAIMGIIFGIERFQKKQYVEGGLEIASGIASIFPGLGTLASGIIDGLLLAKDLGVVKADKEGVQVFNKKINFEDIPVIGSIIKTVKAVNEFKKDPLGSLKQIANFAETLVPGLGQTFVNSFGWIQSLKDMPVVKKLGNFGQKIDDFFQFDKVFGTNKKSSNNSKFYSLEDGGKHVSLQNMNKDLMTQFEKLAKDYFAETGKMLQVNSAFRDKAETQRLLDMKARGELTGPVATYGKSAHNYGNALDINQATANQDVLQRLFKKYGFHQPYKDKNDPQHIELVKGFSEIRDKLDEIVEGTLEQTKTNQSNVINPYGFDYKNKPSVVELGVQTINSIAEKIGEKYKNNMPNITNKQVLAVNPRR